MRDKILTVWERILCSFFRIAGNKAEIKATPHNYCRSSAQSDFSSDCINLTQEGCRLSRKICAIWRKICKQSDGKGVSR